MRRPLREFPGGRWFFVAAFRLVCNGISFEFREVSRACFKLCNEPSQELPGDQGRPSILGDGLLFLINIGPGNIKPFAMFFVTGSTISKSVYASLRMTNLVVCLTRASQEHLTC